MESNSSFVFKCLNMKYLRPVSIVGDMCSNELLQNVGIRPVNSLSVICKQAAFSKFCGMRIVAKKDNQKRKKLLLLRWPRIRVAQLE